MKSHNSAWGKSQDKPPTPVSKTVLAQSRAWTGRSGGGYFGYWIFIMVLRILGLWGAYLLLVPVSFYFVLFAPGYLKASMEYWKRQAKCGPPLSLLHVYRHFYGFGQVLVDRVGIAENPERFKVEEDGLSHILAAIEEKKGLVLLVAPT